MRHVKAIPNKITLILKEAVIKTMKNAKNKIGYKKLILYLKKMDCLTAYLAFLGKLLPILQFYYRAFKKKF